jgi:hypothetical protein
LFPHHFSLSSPTPAEKGHDNPIGMCASVLDLALGFLEEENENEKTEYSDTRMTSEKSPVPVPIPQKAQTNKTSLFEILRNRIEDEKPLVRVKAIQIFGTALSLNYPKRVNNNNRDNEITVFQNEELDSQAEHFGNIQNSVILLDIFIFTFYIFSSFIFVIFLYICKLD